VSEVTEICLDLSPETLALNSFMDLLLTSRRSRHVRGVVGIFGVDIADYLRAEITMPIEVVAIIEANTIRIIFRSPWVSGVRELDNVSTFDVLIPLLHPSDK